MPPGKLETDLRAAVSAGRIRGALVCATDSASRFTYSQTLGHRTLLSSERRPHQLTDVIALASATKLLTTIAALQCVQDGLIALDESLYPIAPELHLRPVLVRFSDAGEPVTVPQKRHMTLRMLLTHSAGLGHPARHPLLRRWDQHVQKDPARRRTVEELYDHPLVYQPGTAWAYGPSLDWVGRIVERVTGKPLTDHMHERIFAPLAIKDASFYPVTRPDLRRRLVDLNPDDPEGLAIAVSGGTGLIDPRARGDLGSHGLFMAAADFIKVLAAVLRNDGALLDRATARLLFDAHLAAPAAASHREQLCGPSGPNLLCGTHIGMQPEWGLGYLLTTRGAKGWYGARTMTWGGGFTLTWFIDRANDLCGFCAIQARLPFDHVDVINRLKQAFRRQIYEERTAFEWARGTEYDRGASLLD